MHALIKGIKLAWDEAGTREHGPALLFVHGFPLDRTSWRPQLDGLSDAGWLIAPDLRGHGASESPPGPYWMESFADDLRALLDHLGMQRVVYCGLSLGGYIAFAFARRYPERLAGLILADTRAGADTPERRAGREELAQLVEREGSGVAVDRLVGNYLAPASVAHNPALLADIRRVIAATPPVGLAATARGIAMRPDSTGVLSRIAVPTAIIVGAEDVLTPPALSQEMQAAIPDSTLTIIPGAGHLANLEASAPFNSAVRALLDRLPGH